MLRNLLRHGLLLFSNSPLVPIAGGLLLWVRKASRHPFIVAKCARIETMQVVANMRYATKLTPL
jgi:hypothetical protein